MSTGSRYYASRSLWLDQAHAAGDPLRPRAPLDGHTDVDVCIVGAGLTGLWTAYYLTERNPGLSILVVEREIAGFGASGRNGGWCSALLPMSAPTIAAKHGPAAARDMRAAMRATVDEVGRVAALEGIECDFVRGGTLGIARSAPQLARARREVAGAAPWGDELDLLDAAATTERVRAAGARGAVFTPDCARIQPATLVRGLARVVEARGVRIVEQTEARTIAPRQVRTTRGMVHARTVVRGTEAWTSQFATSHRRVAPVYSLMIATEPLPDEVWAEIGLDRFETFADLRHTVVYGQRTVDGRIAFGGRGAPYHWGSAIDPDFDTDPHVFSSLHRTLVDLLPQVRGARITHAWGGAVAIPRDWHASVGLDPSNGLAWAGGYVGDGLATTNLAGRTLADLISRTDSPLVRLPWVGHASRRWEPEPLRWLGINAGIRLAELADAEESFTGRSSLAARALGALTGH